MRDITWQAVFKPIKHILWLILALQRDPWCGNGIHTVIKIGFEIVGTLPCCRRRVHYTFECELSTGVTLGGGYFESSTKTPAVWTSKRQKCIYDERELSEVAACFANVQPGPVDFVEGEALYELYRRSVSSQSPVLRGSP